MQTFAQFTQNIQPRWVFGCLFSFALLCFLALLGAPRSDGQLIGSDGSYYYVFARSWIMDGDVDFTNEYAHYNLIAGTWERTATGLPPNKYAIGPAILWMPFFLAAHAIALVARTLGFAVAADGYSYLYQAAISIGSIIYGSLGFWLAYVCTRRLFTPVGAIVSVAIVWLASNAFYYMVFEPSMPHMVSLFSVAVLLTMWFLRFRDTDPPPVHWGIALGAAGGLVLLVRLQDAPLLLLPYGSILVRWLASLRSQDGKARDWFVLGLATAVTTVVVFFPQFLVWQIMYGPGALSPYINDHETAFYWFQPQIANVLFSATRGLFAWHPVFLLSVLGLPLVFRRDRYLALGLAMLLVANVYIVAAWWSWWQGASFGGRMFLNATWVWVLGLAALIDWLRSHRAFPTVLLVGTLLIAWNALSLVQYRLAMIPWEEPLTWTQLTTERMELPQKLLERLRGR